MRQISSQRAVMMTIAVLCLAALWAGCGRKSDTRRQYVYVANAKDNTVSMLNVEPKTGMLAFLGTVPTGKTPVSATVDRSGRFLLVPNAGSNDTSVFTINAKAGMLTPLPAATMKSGWGPGVVMMPTSERVAYILNRQSNNIAAFEVGAATGLQMEVTGSPVELPGMRGAYGAAIEAGGRFGFVTNMNEDQLAAFMIDEASGAWTPLEGSPYRAGRNPGAVAVHPNGRLVYVAANDGIWGFEIDKSSGALRSVTGSPFPGTGIGQLFCDPSGKYLLAGAAVGTVFAYQVDTISGSLRILGGPRTVLKPISSIAMPESGGTVYVTNLESDQVFVFTLSDTGTLKPAAGSPFPVIEGARAAAARPASGEASFSYQLGGTAVAVTPRYP